MYSLEEVFCENSRFDSFILKRYILLNNLKERKREICGIDTWMNKEISLQIHHKDGNNRNNTIDNLQLLCPNCHSQTDTFSGRNKVKFCWKNVDIEKIKIASEKCTSKNQLLKEIGCFSIGKCAYNKLNEIL